MDEGIFIGESKDDLLGLITYLNEQIQKRKEIEKELVSAKEAAEASRKVKEYFLANMSHEIRTPMNAILGMANQLEKTKLNDKQRFFLDTLQTATDNLLNIINDILDLSKVESGRFSLEEIGFSLKSAIERACIVMKHRAEEKGLSFGFTYCDEKLAPIHLGDPYRLNQVLLNLISNAIKFTARGTVSVTCKVLDSSELSQKINIEVSDSGIGMDEEFLNHLFDKFSQEDNSVTRKFGGTGLGMSISKHLVELMGGNITVQSSKGKGTVISIILDLNRGNNNDLPQDEFVHFNTDVLMDKAILVTDDNEMNRLVATSILKNYGARITEATNGQESIHKLRGQHFDLVLMDVQMPVLDGIEATKIIREDISRDLPIIALTAFAIKGDNNKCFEAGMNDYLAKPFEESHLLQVVCRWLDKSADHIDAAVEDSGRKSQLYDLAKLLTIGRGDMNFIHKMVGLFINQIPESVVQMKEAYAQGDNNKLQKIAHRLKPSIHNMCIDSIKNEIDEMANGAVIYGKSEKLEQLLDKIDVVLTAVVEELKTYLIQ